MADTKQQVKAAEEKMTFAIEYLDEQLAHIRAGKANPKILDGIKVMYYGSPVPLTNVASVNTPDAKTIIITPWEKPLIKDIEKAIMNSEIGITPENNGEIIRLGIPPQQKTTSSDRWRLDPGIIRQNSSESLPQAKEVEESYFLRSLQIDPYHNLSHFRWTVIH